MDGIRLLWKFKSSINKLAINSQLLTWSLDFSHVYKPYGQSFSKISKYEPRSDKRDLLAIKSKVRYLQRRKDLAVMNNYRKSEENILD